MKILWSYAADEDTGNVEESFDNIIKDDDVKTE